MNFSPQLKLWETGQSQLSEISLSLSLQISPFPKNSTLLIPLFLTILNISMKKNWMNGLIGSRESQTKSGVGRTKSLRSSFKARMDFVVR